MIAVQYFNPVYLKSYFHENMMNKKGGGRDGLTPQTFLKRYNLEFDDIANRCLNGTYRFSPYKEKLLLKGRNKSPRVLSIPSMRDRLVLGVLNQYLQYLFPEAVPRSVPNQYIKTVSDYLASNASHRIYFLKTDITGFYDNLDLNLLYEKLSTRVDDSILFLIINAIDTITISEGSKKKGARSECRLIGVPQGLAISNILAAIYMMDFDDSIRKTLHKEALYLRYVDDILVLSLFQEDLDEKSIIEDLMWLKCKTLTLSLDKTRCGIIGEIDVDYIGYIIKSSNLISVREKNVQTYLNRMSRLISRYRSQKKNPFLRPKFIAEDAAFDAFYVALINRNIAGCKIDNHLYGWMPYFQAMTDLHILYVLDAVVHKKFLKGLAIEGRITHLPYVYWDIKKHAGSNTLYDYDNITKPSEMRLYLLQNGMMSEDEPFSDEEIKLKFAFCKEHQKKIAQKSVGTTY